MERSLMDLAEAAKGLNSEMHWTLSEEIARRQIAPIFTRCASGDLSPTQALDVSMDCISAKLDNTMSVFDKIFRRLYEKTAERFEGHRFRALTDMEEFFMGLNSDAAWSTNTSIARQELAPVFQRCASGELTTTQALDVFIDNMIAKRDFILSLLQDMVRRLALEVQELESSVEVSNSEDQSS